MKSIYFKLKESSLSSAASNGERDKDGVLWCRPYYVVNVVRGKELVSKGEVRKETKLERRRKQKIEDRLNRHDKPFGVVWGRTE